MKKLTLSFVLLALLFSSSNFAYVVITEVEKGSLAEAVGLVPAVKLTGWEWGDSSGSISTLNDWYYLEHEVSPRGNIKLSLIVDSGNSFVEMKFDNWGITVRPAVSDETMRLLNFGKNQILQNQEKGLAIVKDLFEKSSEEGLDDHIWLGMEYADILWKAGQKKETVIVLKNLLVENPDRSNIEIQCILRRKLYDYLYLLGEMEEAVEIQKENVSIKKSGYGPDSLSLAGEISLLGFLYWDVNNLNEAERYISEAFEIYKKSVPDSIAYTKCVNNLGALALMKGEMGSAENFFMTTLQNYEKLMPQSDKLAGCLKNLGVLTRNTGQYERSEEYYRRALEIYKTIEPEGLKIATTYNNIGTLKKMEGLVDEAEELYLKSLKIASKVAPESWEHGQALNAMSVIFMIKGYYAEAEEYANKCNIIFARLSPGSIDLAATYNNLGTLAVSRGDLQSGEKWYVKTLEILNKLAPESANAAAIFTNIGEAAWSRGEFEKAENYLKKSYEIYSKVAPGSIEHSICILNLGLIEFARKDYSRAVEYFKDALEIREKLAPQSMKVASCLTHIGLAKAAQNKLDEAEQHYLKALSLREKIAPNSLMTSQSYWCLGDLEYKKKNYKKAIQFHLKALNMRKKLAPGSNTEADSYYRTGLCFRGVGNIEKAADYLENAVNSFESQLSKLGGTDETKAGFRSSFMYYYHDYIDLLIKIGEKEKAFSILERSRARMLIEMLAERDLVFSEDISPEVDRKRRYLGVEYSRKWDEISSLDYNEEPEKVVKLKEELANITDEINMLKDQIKTLSPQFASLKYPEPLTFEDVKKILPKGCLLLSFSVGEENTHIFSLGPSPDDYSVFTIDIGEEQLSNMVRKLRGAVKKGSSENIYSLKLTETLLQPVKNEIGKSDRLLISADGPLQFLPFSILKNPLQRKKYLVKTLPIHYIVSMTVYSELISEKKPGKLKITAFADPFCPESIDEKELPYLLRGEDIAPLPMTREEVGTIRKMFPETEVFNV